MASNPNERIRAARERAGLDPSEMAHRLGISYEEYSDLEAFEDEAWIALSIRQLGNLARVLGVTPLSILDDEGRTPPPTITFAEFSQTVADSVRSSGGDAGAWGERAGWDVEPLLRDPEEIWNLNGEGLRDIAGAAGVDWRAVLPG